VIPDQLPASARTKLANIAGAADDARDASASASRRIADIQKALAYSETPVKDAPNLEHEMTRLRAVREQQSQRQRAWSSLHANIAQWLAGQRGQFEPVEYKTKPLPGETIHEAVARFRREIEQTKAVLANVERAPLPKADLKKLAERHVQAMAARGRPNVTVERGELSITFTDGKAFGVSPERAIAHLAWLHPDAMLARFTEAIDAMSESPHAMPESERLQRLAEGRASLEQLERSEESLIVLAAAEGVEVMRRPTADPLAVLGIGPKRQRAKAA
jgi:hypothetical protein